MIQNNIVFSTVDDPYHFSLLGNEWNILFNSIKDANLSQSFDWSRICWESFAKHQKAKLKFITGRLNGKLCILFPLISYRKYFLQIIQQLGSESYDYTDVLVDPSLDKNHAINCLFDYIFQDIEFDNLHLMSVRSQSELHNLINTRNYNVASWKTPSSFVNLQSYKDWNGYLKSRSNKYRSNLARKERRLGENGEIDFEVITDPKQKLDLLNWMIFHKKRWMKERSFNASWIDSNDYRYFLEESLKFNISGLGRYIFVLKSGDNVIAAELSNVDRSRVEWWLGVHSDQYSQHSPGQILKLKCLKWAFDRGLNYDLRRGDEPEKSHWKNEDCDLFEITLSNSLFGSINNTIRRLNYRSRQIRIKLKNYLKEFINR
jgi:CelD/BcsL family acetyltransferase involved in cellulose biosynthesis